MAAHAEEMEPRQSAEAAADKITLGTRIARAREGRGWTIAYVAKRMGAKWQDVSDWEAGRRMPRFEVGLQLARVLGMSLDDFFSEDYVPPHAAWPIFIAAYPDLSDDHRHRLARIPWGDSEPTVEAYSAALTALRLAKPRS